MKNQRKIEVTKQNILEGDFVSVFLGFRRRNGALGHPENHRKSRKVKKNDVLDNVRFFAKFPGMG